MRLSSSARETSSEAACALLPYIRQAEKFQSVLCTVNLQRQHWLWCQLWHCFKAYSPPTMCCQPLALLRLVWDGRLVIWRMPA